MDADHAEAAPHPEDGAPSSVGVVMRFGQHHFTPADEQDVVRVQSLYRRFQGQAKAEAKAEERAAARLERVRRNTAPIAMPSDSEDDDAVAEREAATARAEAEQRAKGLPPVDPTALRVTDTSDNTQGMQRVYRQMLRSKSWW